MQCEGDGGLRRYGRFFSAIGLRTYAFYDRQKNDAIAHQIVDVFDATWELEQTGIEHLLAGETAMDVIHDYLATASEWDDNPRDPRKPERFEYDPNGDDDDVRSLCGRVLRVGRGRGYARLLVEFCSTGDLPTVIVTALEQISGEFAERALERRRGRVGFAFDQFAPRAADLLERSDVVRTCFSHAHPLILVDEFQDTDEQQWRLIRALADDSEIIALGHTEQRIYAWRKGE